MNNRKPQMESKEPIAGQAEAQSTDNGKPNESRRRFTKAGLLAPPVLMSVASRPVFGAQCLSNALSGNLSHPDRGECSTGYDPAHWRGSPGSWPGSIDNTEWPYLDDIYADHMVADPPTWPSNCADCNSSGSWICVGGTLFSDVFGGSDARSMYQILCDEGDSASGFGTYSRLIAALLNALTNGDYALTVVQVRDIANNDPYIVSKISDIDAFLESTWSDWSY